MTSTQLQIAPVVRVKGSGRWGTLEAVSWVSNELLTRQHRDCRGCLRASGQEEVDGGRILLGTHWTVNHYDDRDGFLGWLVVQPIQHRMVSSELTKKELQEFGVVTCRLENALKVSYDKIYPGDKVKIIYLVRLGESTLGRRPQWHLHYHMIPRTASVKKKYWGWKIAGRKKGIKPKPSRSQIEGLMNLIRHYSAK